MRLRDVQANVERACGMVKCKPGGGEKQPLAAQHASVSGVFAVADDGMACGGQVSAQLVGSSGFGMQGDGSDPIGGQRAHGCIAAVFGAAGFAVQRSVEGAAAGQAPADDGAVGFADFAVPELAGEFA